MHFSIVVNGTGHAFLREFGCSCERCLSAGHRANTSVSIIGRNEKSGLICWHALVDVGLGVVTSLCDLFRPADARLDWLLLTHWHPDHCLELNRLGETMRRLSRARGEEKFRRIPTWVRTGTACWLQKNNSYEWHRCLKPLVSGEQSPPGTLLDPIPVEPEELVITPVSVSHVTADIDHVTFKETFHSSASFVVEAGNRKAVLLWDLDNGNDWIMNPDSREREDAVNLMSDADYLFIDCLTWGVEEVRGHNTGHLSFGTVRKYAAKLRPRQTLLVHLSGHEDGEGAGRGWSDERWTDEAGRVWREEGLPGTVGVPGIADEFSLRA
ncbi:MAG: hypothetical protein JXO48_10255 [Deltaproteobacteria bacterium]|nr:hypothetical protein [Deltaproteobacteria bacterium]